MIGEERVGRLGGLPVVLGNSLEERRRDRLIEVGWGEPVSIEGENHIRRTIHIGDRHESSLEVCKVRSGLTTTRISRV